LFSIVMLLVCVLIRSTALAVRVDSILTSSQSAVQPRRSVQCDRRQRRPAADPSDAQAAVERIFIV
jgi:hypothetical protein